MPRGELVVAIEAKTPVSSIFQLGWAKLLDHGVRFRTKFAEGRGGVFVGPEALLGSEKFWALRWVFHLASYSRARPTAAMRVGGRETWTSSLLLSQGLQPAGPPKVYQPYSTAIRTALDNPLQSRFAAIW